MSAPAAPSVVVVGGGLVAATVARELRRLGHAGPVTIVSDEVEPPYDRPPLSKQLLAGTVTAEETHLLKPGEIDDLGITLRLGVAAAGLETAAQEVVLADGVRVPYDRLVLATGSRARRLPSVPELTGVHHLRALGDSTAIATELASARRLVVIGAGFIGLEVAAVARSQDIDVTVVETAARPLTRVLGSEAGSLLTDMHAEHGATIRCSTTVTEVRGTDGVEGVLLDGGELLPADLLLVGVGAVPNTEWLAGSGVAVDDGVVCDATGCTSVPDVFAAGDVSRWRNASTGAQVRVEQWQSALEQAMIVADALTGGSREWDSVPYFWSDQYDTKLQLCGAAGPRSERRETARGPVVLFGDDADRLVGVLTVGNPRALAQGRRLVAAGTAWEQAEEWLAGL
ncbi:FAD-dependent oxidoreductase [Geodermatophilus sp. DF01-2]|uniref:NAD(P)/FAD-dependent oxidoreductase n=1 Tax=Geodermatophilus sp. DF01-2 TaxID=2559610 RepID=UPI001073241C|nr:FAD-dependent oxidoreductase [Geodermatophilus sp. DF01_2]TFV54294.1 FAD-dependent oxidoreductase [Geodermatophilus sp. DF01_2]